MSIIPRLACCILLSGCAPTIIDYDAEKEETLQVEKLKAAQKKEDPFNNPLTPPYVKLQDTDEVYVEVFKLKDISDHRGVKLQNWEVFIGNKTDRHLCVIIDWKLQDFELESDQPIDFLLKPKEFLDLGKMKQTIWSFDDVAIAIPPSGYIKEVKTQDSEIDEKTKKYTCDMPEEEIDDEKVIEE